MSLTKATQARLLRVIPLIIVVGAMYSVIWTPPFLTEPQGFEMMLSYKDRGSISARLQEFGEIQDLVGLDALWVVNGTLKLPQGRYQISHPGSKSATILTDKEIVVEPLTRVGNVERLIRLAPMNIADFDIEPPLTPTTVTLSWLRGREVIRQGQSSRKGFTLIVGLQAESPVRFHATAENLQVLAEGVRIRVGTATTDAREGLQISGAAASPEGTFEVESLAREQTKLYLQFAPANEPVQVSLQGKADEVKTDHAVGFITVRDDEPQSLGWAGGETRGVETGSRLHILAADARLRVLAGMSGLTVHGEGSSRAIWRSGAPLTLGRAALWIRKLGPFETLLGIIAALVTILTPGLRRVLSQFWGFIWHGN